MLKTQRSTWANLVNAIRLIPTHCGEVGGLATVWNCTAEASDACVMRTDIKPCKPVFDMLRGWVLRLYLAKIRALS